MNRVVKTYTMRCTENQKRELQRKPDEPLSVYVRRFGQMIQCLETELVEDV